MEFKIVFFVMFVIFYLLSLAFNGHIIWRIYKILKSGEAAAPDSNTVELKSDNSNNSMTLSTRP